MTSVTTDPQTVEVTGPESALRRLANAMTEPVSVADENRPVRERVTVGVADASVRLRTPQIGGGHGHDCAGNNDETVRNRRHSRERG